MGLLDNLPGAIGGGKLEEAGAAALPSILEKVFPSGLQGVLDQLQQSGLGQQVNSWLGRGPNQPITVDELRQGLDNEQVKEVATKLGIPIDRVLELMAGHLPDAVDQQSPNGDLQKPPA